MRLEKDLYVTEVRISKTLNAPYLIEAIGGRYECSLTLNDATLEAWGIDPSSELLGGGMVITLEPRPSSQIAEETDLLIESLEKTTRRKFKRVPNPQFTDELEYVVKLQTPRDNSPSIPCPYFEITLDLDESEYLEFMELPADTIFRISARGKQTQKR